MQIINGDEARTLLRREIGREYGALTEFCQRVGVSRTSVCKMRIGDLPIGNNVARLLRLQRLWDEDRYIWIPRAAL